jgi:hypothetical protein
MPAARTPTTALMDALPIAAARLKQRQATGSDGVPANPLEWAERYRRIDGRPFSLERFRPLRDVYLDPHPHIVIIKAAQRGASEFAVNWAWWALDCGAAVWSAGQKAGLNVAYVFPTERVLQDFSKERFDPLKGEHSHLAALFGGASSFDGVTFKEVGPASYLYVRSANSSSALKTFPADGLVIDEFDEISVLMRTLARKRLNASPCPRELDLSTPSLPSQGIHAEWLDSDRRRWLALCPHCSTYSHLDFFKSVTADSSHYDAWRHWPTSRLRRASFDVLCPSCGRPFDHALAGRWEAEAPSEARRRGYWVPWFGFPTVNLPLMAENATSPDIDVVTEFYRSDLGVPYTLEGSRVTPEMLRRLCADLERFGGIPPPGPYHTITMGVDIGDPSYYRISATRESDDLRYVLEMGVLRGSDHWVLLDDIMDRGRLPVDLAIVDANPELISSRAFVDRHQGRALRAEYTETSNAHGQIFVVPESDGVWDGVVRIERTASMDLVLSRVSSLQESWPADYALDAEIATQMGSPVRVETRNQKTGQVRPRWLHSGPDHWFHACNYDIIASRVLGAPSSKRPAPSVPIGEFGAAAPTNWFSLAGGSSGPTGDLALPTRILPW